MKNFLYTYGGSIFLVIVFAPLKDHLEEWQKFLLAGIIFFALGISYFVKKRRGKKEMSFKKEETYDEVKKK